MTQSELERLSSDQKRLKSQSATLKRPKPSFGPRLHHDSACRMTLCRREFHTCEIPLQSKRNGHAQAPQAQAPQAPDTASTPRIRPCLGASTREPQPGNLEALHRPRHGGSATQMGSLSLSTPNGGACHRSYGASYVDSQVACLCRGRRLPSDPPRHARELATHQSSTYRGRRRVRRRLLR